MSELSIEETNKLRASLGLKPIIEKVSKTEEDANHSELQNCQAAEARNDELKKRITLERERMKTFQKADSGSTLLDAEDFSTTEDWLAGLKAQKYVDDKTPPKPEKYAATHLKGLKVGHNVDDLAQLDGEILTLKDGGLDGPDELVSERLVDRRVDKDGGDAQEVSGSFTLEGEHTSVNTQPSDDRIRVNLYEESVLSNNSDYQKTKKKPAKIKKRKPLATRKRSKDSENLGPRSLEFDDDVADDFELHSVLAAKRRETIKRQKVERSKESFLAEIQRVDEPVVNNKEPEGLVLNENDDFLSLLQKEAPSEAVSPDGLQKEESHGDMVSDGALQSFEMEESGDNNNAATINQSSASTGIASLLGMLDPVQKNPPSHTLPKSKRLMELEAAQKDILGRLSDAESLQSEDPSRQARVTLEREKLAKQNAAIQAEILKDYNPEVKFVYKDAQGNEMTTKEAYKNLSHQFHGKGPGNKKIDKMRSKRQ